MAPRAATDDAVTGEGEFTCDRCGRKFTHGAWYTKHALRCDGTPPTSRIAGGAGAAAKVLTIEEVALTARRAGTKPVVRRKRARIASKRKALPVSRPQTRKQNRKRVARAAHVVSARGHRTPPERTPALSDRAELIDAKEKMLVELRKKAQLIQAAIAGLEALG